MKGETQSEHGGQHTLATPRHSTGPPRKQKGGTPTHKTGRPGDTAALQSPCHPPPQRHPTIHEGPTHHHCEGGAHRGCPTTRTPQTHTRHPHTTHPTRNSARHDSSTRQHCNGMSRARAHATALGRTAAVHTTAIPHTEEDGHHPLIHSSTPTHSCSHNR